MSFRRDPEGTTDLPWCTGLGCGRALGEHGRDTAAGAVLAQEETRPGGLRNPRFGWTPGLVCAGRVRGSAKKLAAHPPCVPAVLICEMGMTILTYLIAQLWELINVYKGRGAAQMKGHAEVQGLLQ